jgi:hypothetical protein
MNVIVEESPNWPSGEQFVFKELGKPRRVRAIRAEVRGVEKICEVTGVDAGGRWVPAYAVKVADSSDGHAFLIYGGAWGIRLRPGEPSSAAWDFSVKDQWGEPFKVYGSEDDIIYESKDDGR